LAIRKGEAFLANVLGLLRRPGGFLAMAESELDKTVRFAPTYN
jgi:hypothetical protein